MNSIQIGYLIDLKVKPGSSCLKELSALRTLQGSFTQPSYKLKLTLPLRCVQAKYY